MQTITQKNVTIETHFYDNGQLSYREFWVDGKLHRDPKDGPAHESFHDNGPLYFREFWVEGKLHRDPKDGPAYEGWYSDGQLSSREFWVDGKLLSEQEAEALLKPQAHSCEGQTVIVNGREYVLVEKAKM